MSQQQQRRRQRKPKPAAAAAPGSSVENPLPFKAGDALPTPGTFVSYNNGAVAQVVARAEGARGGPFKIVKGPTTTAPRKPAAPMSLEEAARAWQRHYRQGLKPRGRSPPRFKNEGAMKAAMTNDMCHQKETVLPMSQATHWKRNIRGVDLEGWDDGSRCPDHLSVRRYRATDKVNVPLLKGRITSDANRLAKLKALPATAETNAKIAEVEARLTDNRAELAGQAGGQYNMMGGEPRGRPKGSKNKPKAPKAPKVAPVCALNAKTARCGSSKAHTMHPELCVTTPKPTAKNPLAVKCSMKEGAALPRGVTRPVRKPRTGSPVPAALKMFPVRSRGVPDTLPPRPKNPVDPATGKPKRGRAPKKAE